MKPILQWTEDWEIGIHFTDLPKDSEIVRQTLDLFTEFWSDESINEKSKFTLNRYRAALISLGSYVVEQSTYEKGMGKTAKITKTGVTYGLT